MFIYSRRWKAAPPAEPVRRPKWNQTIQYQPVQNGKWKWLAFFFVGVSKNHQKQRKTRYATDFFLIFFLAFFFAKLPLSKVFTEFFIRFFLPSFLFRSEATEIFHWRLWIRFCLEREREKKKKKKKKKAHLFYFIFCFLGFSLTGKGHAFDKKNIVRRRRWREKVRRHWRIRRRLLVNKNKKK